MDRATNSHVLSLLLTGLLMVGCSADTTSVETPTLEPSTLPESLEIEFITPPDRTFKAGDSVRIDYKIRNNSNVDFTEAEVPSGKLVHRLQLLDGDGIVAPLSKEEIYDGDRLDSGSAYELKPVLFRRQAKIGAGQEFPFSYTLPTAGYRPGRYKFYVDFGLFPEYGNRIDVQWKVFEFELVGE